MRMRALVAAAVLLAAACSGSEGPRSEPEDPLPSACAEPDPAATTAVTDFLDLWDDAQVVVLGERHGWVAEHDFLGQLVCDPRFADVVPTIAVEFAGASRQELLDAYIGGDDVAPEELAAVWRDSTQRSGVWDQPVYRTFFERVRAINAGGGTVRVLAGDPPIDWSTITATQDCDDRSTTCLDHWLQQRDRHLAGVVEAEAAGDNVLVIAGVGHVKGTRELVPADGRPPTLPALIEADRPGEVVVVLPSGTTPASDPAVVERLHLGPSPALHRLGGSWLDGTAPCALGRDFADACSYARLDGLTDAFLQLPDPPSPAAAPVVFSLEVDGNVDIYFAPPGDAPVRLTTSPDREFDPDLSPDGTRIAYRRNPDPDSDHADIWIMDVDGSGQRNLTNAPLFSNWAPAWTPDGRIAFSSARTGGPILELWVMDADGTDAARVAPGWCEYASPSPDGTRFACAEAVGGAYDLAVVALDGTRVRLTATPVSEFGASWSPDGEWIAFSRDTGDRWELHRIHPDGSGDSVVAAEGAFPAWSPSGLLTWTGPGGINVAAPDGTALQVVDLPADYISWPAPTLGA